MRSAGSKRSRSTPRSQRRDAVAGDPELSEPLVAGRTRREHHVAGAVEGAKRDPGQRLELLLAGAQARVGGQLGVVAADQRQFEHPCQQPGLDPRGSGAHRWTRS